MRADNVDALVPYCLVLQVSRLGSLSPKVADVLIQQGP